MSDFEEEMGISLIQLGFLQDDLSILRAIKNHDKNKPIPKVFMPYLMKMVDEKLIVVKRKERKQITISKWQSRVCHVFILEFCGMSREDACTAIYARDDLAQDSKTLNDNCARKEYATTAMCDAIDYLKELLPCMNKKKIENYILNR